MPAKQLKDTTMDPAHRMLLKVHLPDSHGHADEERKAARSTADLVESLMGRKPELRFEYIQANAKMVRELDV
jgi:topoisomerase-4 subunit B